jgi:hypothetical protein
MGFFDFVTNPINDAWDAAVDSNPITSGASEAIHNAGESIGVNDVLDKAAPVIAIAAAIYLTGGALGPEELAALEEGAAEAGMSVDEFALEQAGQGAVESGADTALSGYDTTGLDSLVEQQSGAYPMSGYDETGLNNLISEKLDPSYWQQLQSAYGDLPAYGQGALSGAGKGMATNVLVSALTGKPITAQGLLQAGFAGGVGGGLAGATGSNFLGGLVALGTNALLSKSFGPTTMASAIPSIGAGIYNSGSKGSSGSSISSPSVAQSSNINAIEPTSISTGSGLQTGPVLKNTKILQDLKGMYPQLNDVDPKLLSQLGYDVGGNLPTESVNTQTPSEPTFDDKNANMYKTILAGGDTSPLQHFRDGGMPHVPEFITGATGHYVKGRGDGQSDDIPAMLADGEYVFDADTVAQLGNGSSDAGAKLLDHFRESLREHKRSTPSDKIPPKASPLMYMKEALNRHEGKKHG